MGILLGQSSWQSYHNAAKSYKRIPCIIDETQLISGTPLTASARNTRWAGLLSSVISTCLLPVRAGSRTCRNNCQNISEPRARCDWSQLLEAERAGGAMWAGWALSALHWSRDQTWPYQKCSSVTLFWLAPNFHSQAEGHSSDSQALRDIPPRLKSSGSLWVPLLSPVTHGTWSRQRWVPVYSGDQWVAERGGQPGHQCLWKMMEQKVDPCAEAKELQPGPGKG